MTPAEYRALGRLMRHARAEGFTYHVTTAFGRTDWSWSKDGVYAAVAMPMARGWSVHLDEDRVDMWPASVQQLADVMVALDLLPVQFRSKVAVVSPDLFAEDIVPAGPHAVASIAPDQGGCLTAVCMCGWCVTDVDYDAAADALDAHIARPGSAVNS